MSRQEADMGQSPVVERPLSVQQREMLDFIGTRTDDYYLNVEVFLASGRLDVAALRQALSAVVARHETVRSTFPHDGGIYRVLPASEELIDGMWCVDDGVTSVAEAVAEGTRWAGAPLHLDRQPPLRFWVGRVDDATTVLAIGRHYLAFDAWSMTLLYEELAAGYGSADVRGPARQYHDIASDAGPLDGWSDLFDHPFAAARELYRRAANPLGPCATLRCDHRSLGSAVTMAAKRYRVTPYVLGSAAMLLAVSDLLDDPQVLVGSAYAGRVTAGSARVIGYLATTIFVGADLAAVGGVDRLVAHLHQQLRRWYRGPRVQWQPLLERYGAADAYAVKFTLLPGDFARPGLSLDVVSVERLDPPVEGSARRPLDLLATYDDEIVTGHLTYRTDVVDRGVAEDLVDRFVVRLEEICGTEPAPR
jgi:hypothetical protein